MANAVPLAERQVLSVAVDLVRQRPSRIIPHALAAAFNRSDQNVGFVIYVKGELL